VDGDEGGEIESHSSFADDAKRFFKEQKLSSIPLQPVRKQLTPERHFFPLESTIVK
jgi:hypothetical protein